MEGKLYAVKRDNDVERQSPKPLEIVHKSVCGLTRNAYVKGAKYFCYFHWYFFEKHVGYGMKSKG